MRYVVPGSVTVARQFLTLLALVRIQAGEPFWDRLMVGREVLALVVGVRVLFPELDKLIIWAVS